MGDAARNTSVVTPRGNSGVKIGTSSRPRESTAIKVGGSENKRHREGIKLGEGSRARDPGSIKMVTTLAPKGVFFSDTKSKTISAPNTADGSSSVTVGYPGSSATETAPSSTTKLHIGIVVPSKAFGVREYTKAFHAAITGLQTRTRIKKLKLFSKYEINPRYDMKPLTPSPTGTNHNLLRSFLIFF
jgi:hypothetical protein